MKMESRSHRCNINRPSSRHGHKLLSNTKTTFEDQFMKKLSNTEAKLKKSVSYKSPKLR